MKRQDWVRGFLYFTIFWLVDQATKSGASRLRGELDFFYDTLIVKVYHNHGVMLGALSDLPPLLRTVSLSTIGVFFCSLFLMAQVVLHGKRNQIRIGLALLTAGILGNVTDRIITGYVTDFIMIRVGTHFSPVFNLADVFVNFGGILFFEALGREIEWGTRKNFWMKPRFQAKYALTLMFSGMGFAAILGTFSYTYLKVAFQGAHGELLESFIVMFIAVSLCFCAALFSVGVFLSRKTAGPLFAFERFLTGLIDGKAASFRVRKGDDFKEFEEIAQLIARHWHNRQLRAIGRPKRRLIYYEEINRGNCRVSSEGTS